MKNNQTQKQIKNLMTSAIRGKKVYLEIMDNFLDSRMKKVDDTESAIFLFPSHDSDVNINGLIYLDEYLFRWNKSGFAIITSDLKMYQNAKKTYSDNNEIYLIDDEQMNNLICFYRLYLFDPRIKIVSLEQPLGRRGHNLLDVKGVTKEMLVAIGVFGLIPFEKASIAKTNNVTALFAEED